MSSRTKKQILSDDELKEKKARDARLRKIIDDFNNRPPSILEVIVKGFKVFIGWHR